MQKHIRSCVFWLIGLLWCLCGYSCFSFLLLTPACGSVYVRFFLQRFTPGARVLTDKETKGFLSAADDDSDGRIGADGERIHIPIMQDMHKCD